VKGSSRIISLAALAAFLSVPGSALAGQQNGAPPARHQASAANGGTPGRIAKFTTGGKVVDSNITEDTAGQIGVGTTTPTSPLTVNGVVETKGENGGIKFPDGTVQTSAEIRHDPTLKGTGATDSVLGVAIPLYLSGYTPYGQPLVNVQGSFQADGIAATGGAAGNGAVIRGGSSGGHSIISKGGFSQSVGGGYGIIATGGDTDSGVGGNGVSAKGGNSGNGLGGWSVDARGGDVASCCNGVHSNAGTGGIGVRAIGGNSFGFGRRGGFGLDVYPGQGVGGAAIGIAARFNGDVQVNGVLSKAGGSFKIDHPLDPENKYLYHSFVESPDMKNIYDGVISLDANGEAVVEMPEWFGALNRDYRYLLTAVGAPMPGLYVAEEMANNHFKISGGTPGMKVSWQVTGIRQDAWANKHRIPVEEVKDETERGFYLHPEEFDQPEERGVTWAHEPELMRQEKERRLETQQPE
jgi:hypothetical protein